MGRDAVGVVEAEVVARIRGHYAATSSEDVIHQGLADRRGHLTAGTGSGDTLGLQAIDPFADLDETAIGGEVFHHLVQQGLQQGRKATLGRQPLGKSI